MDIKDSVNLKEKTLAFADTCHMVDLYAIIHGQWCIIESLINSHSK